jgi:hypothetical protein
MTLLRKGVGDRVNALRARSASPMSRMAAEADKPAFGTTRQVGGRPGVADAALPGLLGILSKPAHLAVGHLIPFGSFDWVVAQMMGVCSDWGTETRDAEARSHHF